MPDRYFPIHTDTACQLKWTWSTLQLYSGTTQSCHRVESSFLNAENFGEFHNTPKKIQDRELMLQGKWPTGGCEYCKNIEDAGGVSDRQFQLQIPNLVPKELDDNPTAVVVSPRIVEVYLDNVCNMSCVYCWDGFSSKIQAENKKFGRFESGSLVIDNRAQKTENFEEISQLFWQWMDQYYKEIRRLHILGGEPLYQPQFETCLNFLETHANPDLEFNIISNLKVSPERLQKFIHRIRRLVDDKKISRFEITCSIDCFGPEQEYIRFGVDLAEWKQNFEYLVNEPWITLNINQTITALGIKSMPELIEYLQQQRQSGRTIGHYLMACVNRPHLYPGIFGAGFFDKDFERILSIMPSDSWQHNYAKQMMKGLQLEFNLRNKNFEQIKNLQVFLTEMDRRRNLDWRKTFPWLTKEFEHVV